MEEVMIENTDLPKQDMDVITDIELFIPAEAEVIVVPFSLLPHSLITRLQAASGSSHSGHQKESTDFTLVLCITPVKATKASKPDLLGGEKSAGDGRANSVDQNNASLNKCLLPITTSNTIAFRLLKCFMKCHHSLSQEIKQIYTATSNSAREQFFKTARNLLIIYHNKVYLLVNKDTVLKKSKEDFRCEKGKRCDSGKDVAKSTLLVSPLDPLRAAAENAGQNLLTTGQEESSLPSNSKNQLDSVNIKKLREQVGITKDVQVCLARITEGVKHKASNSFPTSLPREEIGNVSPGSSINDLPELTELVNQEENEYESSPKKSKICLNLERSERKDTEMNIPVKDCTFAFSLDERLSLLDPLSLNQTHPKHFDFDDSLRHEKINRIKAILKEKEAKVECLRNQNMHLESDSTALLP
ncbi:uncharacterized protein LOC114648174 [Erpetoichthys calabaricus]|uniref:uncharacterized protein LOC114648174 n=1 Tax=Erpetoichthys calabaricus TaxID=27687 RepID=UPI00109FD432|nr:uncharacterized protein LOC114648174 [Erpetoichthys calabaricus]